MSAPHTGGMGQSSTAGVPARNAHAFAAVATTCLISLASALLLALSAADDPLDRGTGPVRGLRWALHR
jgi:hypothetical protein